MSPETKSLSAASDSRIRLAPAASNFHAAAVALGAAIRAADVILSTTAASVLRPKCTVTRPTATKMNTVMISAVGPIMTDDMDLN
jgi:hypothetical protein